MRHKMLHALILLATSALLPAQIQQCFGTCQTTRDDFPVLVTDFASCGGNPLGLLSHTLTCTMGTTTCSVVGTIDWTPYVAGTANPLCGACNTWNCAVSQGAGSLSFGPATGITYYTNCTPNVTHSHSHPATLSCLQTTSWHAIIRNLAGGTCTHAQAVVTWKCGGC